MAKVTGKYETLFIDEWVLVCYNMSVPQKRDTAAQ